MRLFDQRFLQALLILSYETSRQEPRGLVSKPQTQARTKEAPITQLSPLQNLPGRDRVTNNPSCRVSVALSNWFVVTGCERNLAFRNMECAAPVPTVRFLCEGGR
jgi:hypothetical protein